MKSLFNPRTKFLLVDIETTRQSTIFDISVSVWSRQSGTIGEIGYIVTEYQSHIPYYEDRLTRYHNYVENGEYQVRKFAEIMAICDKLISKHKVDYVAAYNANFDMGHISKECERQGITNSLAKLPVFCIWGGAQETLARQRNFIKFALENSFTTPTGMLSTGAETMARYLKQDPFFEEEHTGYSDNQIEVQILERVLRQKKPLSKEAGHWSKMKGVGV